MPRTWPVGPGYFISRLRRFTVRMLAGGSENGNCAKKLKNNYGDDYQTFPTSYLRPDN